MLTDRGKRSFALPTKWLSTRMGLRAIHRAMGTGYTAGEMPWLDKDTAERLTRCLVESRRIFGDWILLTVDAPHRHVEVLP